MVPFKRGREAEVDRYFGAEEVHRGARVQDGRRECVTGGFAPEVSAGPVFFCCGVSVSGGVVAKWHRGGGKDAYRALRVKFPSHGGTSTLAGVLKYLNEELSGGMTVRRVFIDQDHRGCDGDPGLWRERRERSRGSVFFMCEKGESGKCAEIPRVPCYAEAFSDGDDVGACS